MVLLRSHLRNGTLEENPDANSILYNIFTLISFMIISFLSTSFAFFTLDRLFAR